MAIEDFGKKIGGARKDLWAGRGLRIEDIGDFNVAERSKYITKNNAWPKPDYEKMIDEEGYSRDALYFIKAVRDALPTAPIINYTDSADDIKRKQDVYLDFISEFKEELLKIKTSQDIEELGIQYLEDKGYVTRQNRYSSYTMTSTGEAFINNKFFKAIQMNAAQAQREATKKGFLVDNLGAIKERFSIIEVDGSLSNENAWWNKNGTAIKRDRYGGADYFYPVNETVGEYIKGMNLELYRGNFLIVRDNYILGITHDYLEAQQFVEQQAKSIFDKTEADKAAAKASKSNSNRKKGLVPPILAHIDRKGPKMRNRNIVGEDFLKEFNIKGGEFGNWLNEAERQTNMNMAYDSLKDMAKALNINDADIAMGNRLSIAFGSRGIKGAAAHYEPLREVINLTKMKGAGSLAHELFHAMDDMSGKAMGMTDFATAHENKTNAFTELVRVMKYKNVVISAEEQNKEIDERYKTRIEKLRKDIVKMVPDRNLTPELIEQRDKLINELFDKTKDSEFKFTEIEFGNRGKIKTLINEKAIAPLCQFIDNNSQLYKMTPNNKKWLCSNLEMTRNTYCSERATEPITRRVETEFYKNSKAMDNAYSKATHGYWQSNIEMAARAFACYLHDKMNEMGIKNDYLTGHAFQKGMNSNGDIIPVYPRPEERFEINKAFDKVIEEMKTMGIFHEREEKELAAETEKGFITVKTTEEGHDYSVMDKNYKVIDAGRFSLNVTAHEALKAAVPGEEIQEVDYKVFVADKREHERQQAFRESTGTMDIDPNSYKQMTFEDLMNQAKEISAEKSNAVSFKEQQFEIIQQNNAMTDDYHVGIRSADDIKTFEEAMKDDESFCYGDFEIKDAERALKEGKITVYSSKPIEQGGFVSTSYNMAKDYAGSGKVYSQTVNIKDVAWINGDEGQYAKVPEKELNKSEHSKSQSNRDKDER